MADDRESTWPPAVFGCPGRAPSLLKGGAHLLRRRVGVSRRGSYTAYKFGRPPRGPPNGRGAEAIAHEVTGARNPARRIDLRGAHPIQRYGPLTIANRAWRRICPDFLWRCAAVVAGIGAAILLAAPIVYGRDPTRCGRTPLAGPRRQRSLPPGAPPAQPPARRGGAETPYWRPQLRLRGAF